MTRVISIVKFTISDQLQYLAAYAHEFLCYGWSTRHMLKQYDILEIVLEGILDNIALFIDKEYMIDIFKK